MDLGTLEIDRSVLVLVDYQRRLLPSIHEGTRVLAHALALARLAQLLDVPVLGTEQNPRGLGPNVPELASLCSRTLEKTHFDGCEDGLGDAIAGTARGRDGSAEIVIAGCETHVCLLQTALGLRRARHSVTVVASACGSRRVADRDLALSRLQNAGARIASLETVAFEWLRTSDHPRFKEALALIKELASETSLRDEK